MNMKKEKKIKMLNISNLIKSSLILLIYFLLNLISTLVNFYNFNFKTLLDL